MELKESTDKNNVDENNVDENNIDENNVDENKFNLNISYDKRFLNPENIAILNVDTLQNYMPIFNKFFILNKTNWNNINLNQRKHITKFVKRLDYNQMTCELYDDVSNKNIIHDIHIKYAPLLNPIRYVIGKYDEYDKNMFQLPSFLHDITNTKETNKIYDTNNSAYTEAFFYYLSSKLLNDKQFYHGIDFYGNYLSNIKDYNLNIYDDVDVLENSTFFHNKNGNLFNVDDEIFKLINFNGSNKIKEKITIKDDCLLNDIQVIESDDFNFNYLTSKENNIHSSLSTSSISSLSSRSSNTTLSGDCNEDEIVNLYINDFPANIICIEKCVDTLNNYMENDDVDISNEEWSAIFMQIIMQLIVYQKVFNLTHNDLHSNNVMYVNTDKEYLYYLYNNTYYKVPTFNKIWKIIDFGRAIYNVNNITITSDMFSKNEDAATQYNCEPFYNSKKRRIDPNMSFDLTRLACCLFDYFIEDISWLEDKEELDEIQQLVSEWCLDDKNKNILYKNNGEERYPEFKLYKMIARNVNNHIPKDQLNNPIFQSFILPKKKIRKQFVFNIDEL